MKCTEAHENDFATHGYDYAEAYPAWGLPAPGGCWPCGASRRALVALLMCGTWLVRTPCRS